MNVPKALKTMNSKPKNAQSSSVIKFDMAGEEKIRVIARKGYELAKRFRELGLKFKKIIPASTDPSVRKQFKLPLDSDLICIEIGTSGKNDEQKQQIINDAKDQFLMLDFVRIIDEGKYGYDSSNNVYRFLLKVNIQSILS